ncbi:unnamed protein product [Paramecium octaurelia]|uniref:EF-hand domain-containing protein n=1 Tax=Paramecium octaurelia TaxID=43137 RepID=A0A8S1XQK4_PAROT|nr:unnamed protein product [Paramecium octaurelia]
MNQQVKEPLNPAVCEVFQKLLSDVFIKKIWKEFRESGNLSEGKMTKSNFTKEMLKQLKLHVKSREYSYISSQFFLILAPEEFTRYQNKMKNDFEAIVERSCAESYRFDPDTQLVREPAQRRDNQSEKHQPPDQAFENWFKQNYDQQFLKWFGTNYNSDKKKMKISALDSLFERWFRSNNVQPIFEKAQQEKSQQEKTYFEIWVGKKFETLFEKLFERFQLEFDDKIEIQDLVLSLGVLARMELEKKLELIFDLSDVDEDGCLSIDDIQQMIKRIEKNFTRETSLITSDSQALQNELAFKRAMRKFSWATIKMDKQIEIKNDELGLIEGKKFLDSLKQNKMLFETFLPGQLLLYDVLMTDQGEKEFQIQEIDNKILDENQQIFRQEPKREEPKKEDTKKEEQVGQFELFRKEIHAQLRNNYKDKLSKQYLQEHKGQVRYPGKMEVVQVGNQAKRVPKLEKFEEKKEAKKEKEDTQQNQQKQNNIESHEKRLKDMREQRQQWNIESILKDYKAV